MIPGCWSRTPEGWAQAGSFPFKSVLFPLPHQDLCPIVGSAEAREGPSRLLACVGSRQIQTVPDALLEQGPANISFTLLRCSLGSKSPLSLIADYSPQPLPLYPFMEPHHREGRPHLDIWHVSVCELWQTGYCQSSGLFPV